MIKTITKILVFVMVFSLTFCGKNKIKNQNIHEIYT